MDLNATRNCSETLPIVVLEHNPAAAPKILNAAKQLNKHVDLIISGSFLTNLNVIILSFLFSLWKDC